LRYIAICYFLFIKYLDKNKSYIVIYTRFTTACLDTIFLDNCKLFKD